MDSDMRPSSSNSMKRGSSAPSDIGNNAKTASGATLRVDDLNTSGSY